MAFALIAHTADGDSLGAASTDPVDTTGADLVVYGETSYRASAVGAITDSKSNTIAIRTAYDDATWVRTRLGYALNAIVGSSHTSETVSIYASLYFAAFSGSHLTAPFDQENGAVTAAATALSTGSVTPSQDNELIIATIALGEAVTNLAIDNGFTILDTVAFNSGFYFGGSMAYKIQTTAAAVNPQWTWTTTRDAAAGIYTFKAAAAAGRIPTRDPILQAVTRANFH